MMNYIDHIEKYQAGEMSDVEKLAFEDELQDNPRLQQALQAYELAAAVINAGSRSTTRSSGKRKRMVLGSLAGALCVLLSLSIWWMTSTKATVDTSDSAPTVQPLQELQPRLQTEEQEEATAPVAQVEPLKEDTSGEVKRDLPEQSKQQSVKPLAAQNPTKEVAQINLAPPAVATVELDTVIRKGHKLVVASEKVIVLKPGFRTEPGGEFNAVVKEKSPSDRD